MNCDKCQDLLSDFLDGTLTGDDGATFSTHLDECLSCVDVRSELESIVSVARSTREEYAEPPNARAMWVRIRNSIEIELEATRAAEAASSRSAAAGGSFWTRLMGKRLELSLPQLTLAVAALVFVVSTVTTVGLQGWRSNETLASSSGTTSVNTRAGGNSSGTFDVASDALYHQTYMQQQEARLSYWKKNVEARKASWNPQMRNSFDRSMSAIDKAIADSASKLDLDPHDEISLELLNAAMREKMELLRGFSDQ